jgi:S-adenosylmethionine:tRNA ribosyltransferase-isomerase
LGGSKGKLHLRTSDFDYDLPTNFIAQTPLDQRDHSRLLVLDRQTGQIEHTIFKEIGNFLKSGDILVINKTRVIPARIFARKLPSGGRAEILLLRKRDAQTWEALVGGKGLTAGKKLQVESVHPANRAPVVEIMEVMTGAQRLVRFSEPLEKYFPDIGHVPLPPYIHERLEDPERYQTVYARTSGSAAAPTAGLHFTPELMALLKAKGVQFTTITLHVGLDTFAPVNEADPQDHVIHTEWCQLSPGSVDKIRQAQAGGGRVVAVGTTSVRTLESAAQAGSLQPFERPTNLFILPGYRFRVVDAMITNFHLPRSTLIMLVSAFAGSKRILSTYETAKQAGYRFYSFGDAMLII